tara:strand:+ start:439 stop:1545 length:1107 start_codon:yes stop_codon:yes gene_type:complete
MEKNRMQEISWWRTSMGNEEIARVSEAISAEHLSQGPVTAKFESALSDVLGVPYVMSAPSGSAALFMAMLAIGVGPGDEVIVPNMTWIASAHGAALLGAKIVLADTVADRPVLDVTRVRDLITPKTKAVIPTHLNGRAVDMEALNRLADEHGFHVVEDACQALFSKNGNGYLGTQSDIGCFSLGVTKLITTGQGGFVATRSEETYRALQAIKMHGVVTDEDGRETYLRPGFNFKYADILAAIGLAQLDRVEERQEHVRAVHERYARVLERLDYLEHIGVDVDGGELPLWVEVTTPYREALRSYLAGNGIETQRVHLHLDLAAHLAEPGIYPNSHRFSREGLILPCGPSQPLENVDRVIGVLSDYRPPA